MIHKPVLITLGFVFVSLAFLGLFLHLVPTTQFLLLAVYCFAKSSVRVEKLAAGT